MKHRNIWLDRIALKADPTFRIMRVLACYSPPGGYRLSLAIIAFLANLSLEETMIELCWLLKGRCVKELGDDWQITQDGLDWYESYCVANRL